ncbi:unnamed protein product [Lampetra planeri]
MRPSAELRAPKPSSVAEVGYDQRTRILIPWMEPDTAEEPDAAAITRRANFLHCVPELGHPCAANPCRSAALSVRCGVEMTSGTLDA